MSLYDRGPAESESAEEARVRVGTALSLLELAVQVLEELPLPEVAFALGDRDLYRYLHAAEAARSRLVGHGKCASAEDPSLGTALGDGRRIYEWSEEDTDLHFLSAIRDWSVLQ